MGNIMKLLMIAGTLMLACAFPSYAHQVDASSLLELRKEVIMHYIDDLQQADYKNISALFEKNGTVVSTSRGKVNAKEFFYAFLPEIASATTELHQTFVSDVDQNRFGARFHFNFTLKDGEKGNGEYVDEFVFADNSSLLTAVYMFENLKFTI